MTALSIFVALVVVSLGWLWTDIGRASLAAQKGQTMADVTALSSLRITVESLQTVAARWNEFGASFGGVSADGTIMLPAQRWDAVFKKASDLKKALPGYQGRSTSIVKVVAEANGFSRSKVDVTDPSGAQIALRAEKGTVQDEFGRKAILDGAWYSRQWPATPAGEHKSSCSHATNVSVRPREGGPWHVVRPAHGRIIWDADNEIKPNGNGGYPAMWGQAVKNGRLDPNRWPVFRAVLEQP